MADHPSVWKQNRVKVFRDNVDENGTTFDLRLNDRVPRHVIVTNTMTPDAADPANDILLAISYDGDTNALDILGPRQSREIPGGTVADLLLLSSDETTECGASIVCFY